MPEALSQYRAILSLSHIFKAFLNAQFSDIFLRISLLLQNPLDRKSDLLRLWSENLLLDHFNLIFHIFWAFLLRFNKFQPPLLSLSSLFREIQTLNLRIFKPSLILRVVHKSVLCLPSKFLYSEDSWILLDASFG